MEGKKQILEPRFSSLHYLAAALRAQSRYLAHILKWKFWRLGICKALVPLQRAWKAFSQPVPASCSDLLIQLLLCVSLASVTAGLVHHWLISSQLYPRGPPALVTTVCGLLVFLSLALVPPIRCLFALSVPTLGSEQGRRLLLSYSVANLAVAVVPNVLANVGAAGRVLRCVTKGSLESLLNTTYQLRLASQALGSVGHAGGRSLAFEAQGNGSVFRLHMHMVTQQILEDFSGLEFLAQAALGIQRLVTGLFMLGLLGESAWYLHRYLTDLRFDNIYATRQLVRQLAQAGATHLLASPPPWLLQAAQPKLSHEELLSCLLRLGLLTLLLVSTAVTVATDYGAFLLAQAAVAWAQKLPTVPITLTVKYDASYKLLDFIHFVLNQPPVESVFASAQSSFQWELYSLPHDCHLPPAQPPRVTAALAAGALQLLAGATLVLQAYAWRLRHAIAASFFPAQEARRVSHLKDRLQRRHDRSDRLDRQACTMGTWEPREPVQEMRALESQGPQSLGPSLASV
ncbi:osteoclast stimulatory transmembrane protein [Peromyscus californicus insignis]|uniref:osteoclast stimulatory transmembrane protein n=1 Tax=Peromyscus californicus insignis TaxID=564181 RepID=UPI0022A65E78|nr:osteoclast stimulatory transmembrane protein [Peromyscus californicus insignis]